MKLNVMAFGITCGLLWGFGILFITFWVMFFEGATGDPLCIGYVYRGYCVSYCGALIGMAWGLVDGFIGGAIFAWLYNFMAVRVGKTAG